MEDGGKVVTNEVEPLSTAVPVGSINQADSTSKLSPNELSPDSTSEFENTVTKTDRFENFVSSNSKVNGDCNIDCSVPSPSSAPVNNNNTSIYKTSLERNISSNEKRFIDEVEESKICNVDKDLSASEAEIATTGFKEKEQTKNLSLSPQQKLENPSVGDNLLGVENFQLNQSETISNLNEVSSTLEEKTTCEASEVLSCTSPPKTETMPAAQKTKRSSSDSSSSSSCKSGETYNKPRCDHKSSALSAVLECRQKQNDISKGIDKLTSKNNKRKCEEKLLNSTDGELNETEKFPIQYKGFKKKANIEGEGNEKRFSLKWNPFNPACKPKRKNKNLASRLPTGDEIDCSSLQQSEYAQYLGLQPILKFRCSNCGSSAFQSMVALNTHQIECTKTGKGKLDKSPPSSFNNISEPKSTNIKLTRKVFLCSACGTYYEHWNLFLHMREVHRRYICLYCLGMFSVAEKLSEHLFQKHKVTHQNFNNLDDFHKHSYQTFFLLCLTCDKVFSEMDDFYGHTCTAGKKSIDNNDATNKSEVISGQDSSATTSGEPSSNVPNNKTGAKRIRDSNKKNINLAKAVQPKKDELLAGNIIQKPEESINSDSKEDITKPNDVSTNKSLETNTSSVNETIHSENNTHIQQNENELKGGLDQDVKLQESQVSTDTDKPLKSTKKTKPSGKKTLAKRKKPKEKEEDNDVTAAKIKKVTEGEPTVTEVKSNASDGDSHLVSSIPVPETVTEVKEESLVSDVPQQIQTQERNNEKSENLEELGTKTEDDVSKDLPNVSKDDLTTTSNSQVQSQNINTSAEVKNKLQANLLKFKLPGIESDNESDDSQKLSLVVDENPVSDAEHKTSVKSGENSETDSEVSTEKVEKDVQPKVNTPQILHIPSEGGGPGQDITLASEDVAVMALTLDDKIENIPIQTVLKECVRTSCMSCNYCRHAVKIAVNGKQLAIHILSEHRYMPIKNETTEDVINKLKASLTILQTMYFNTETYDSSDPSIHVPYDQDSSFDCFQCNYVTTSHRDLFAHKRKSHAKSLLLCIMCKSNFYSYSELLCHLCPGSYNAEIQFHNVDINFRCCFCRLDTIPSAFRLMVHLRKTHHTCDICLENGVDQQKLSTHMWKHKLNHLCYRCGIAYASKPDITKHLFWKHGHESVLCKKCLQKKWPHVYHFCIPPTSFICEECNTSFSKAVALKVHKRIHGNDFPYTCSECNKKFVSKKLLQRHEERHIAIKNNSLQNNIECNNHEEQKEELINVSDDVINENKETTADFTDSKEVEAKDKSHRKHKKEKDKDKKDKQVVDVYNLPPLNLSSESDSSDEENNAAKDNCRSTANTNLVGEGKKDAMQEICGENDKVSSYFEETASNNLKSNVMNTVNNESEAANVSGNEENKPQPKEEIDIKKEERVDGLGSTDLNMESTKIDDSFPVNTAKTDEEGEVSSDLTTSSYKPEDNKEVEDIWKNFYSTNPQNSNLPYPLCAIKSEIALGIIMGDHDYCSIPIEPPKFRENIPSTSGISVPLINDQLQEINETPLEKLNDTSILKDPNTTASPLDSPKKKPKSPKKKNSKVENENNSSSSSDSSSESSSSSCSCGPNCSCSSSSSNSSSSSSSDSESSGAEEGTKQERKRKKRERRSKTKSDHEPEQPKEQIQPQPEKIIPVEPEDPPIRESELETDETTTDEEFYDQQPQRIANQLLAEKRNQLMLLASAANANNGNASPSPIVDVLPPSTDVVNTQKQKIKTKRKRKITTKGKTATEKAMSNSEPYQQYSAKEIEPVAKPLSQYHGSTVPQIEQTKIPFVLTPQAPTETPGSGSETEKSRSSKRRRIPNKFYGYSSGDEEEKATPSPKWRKQDTISQPARVQPVHPPTPRIQLTLPKQVIRKPYKLQKTPAKPLQQPPPPPPQNNSSSDSTDSSSEMDNQTTATPTSTAHVPLVTANVPVAAAAAAVGGVTVSGPAAATVSGVASGAAGQDAATTVAATSAANTQKNDKDVYCYCRCPYDEVSEMIACDDENCEIEWFHFECVGILVPPRGQWFCPGCRKARGLPT